MMKMKKVFISGVVEKNLVIVIGDLPQVRIGFLQIKVVLAQAILNFKLMILMNQKLDNGMTTHQII